MTPEMPVTEVERMDRESRALLQGQRLSSLVRSIYGRNAFYTKKLEHANLSVNDLRFPDDLEKLPLTDKSQLVSDQTANPPWGTAMTEPLHRYTRYWQTSSTTGPPLRWLDTSESWQWVLDCWKAVYRSAGVTNADRMFFPFSFGPFLGLWSAFEAACQIGAQCVPGGGMSSLVRLRMIETIGATVVCCTPTYALCLAEAADAESRAGRCKPLREGTVRLLIVTGEPGGSIRATRQRIEMEWGARVVDHHGLTEVGPISFECWQNPGALHLNEGEFICEMLDSSGRSVAEGQQGELVVTNLGRTASPVIRYRTGDLMVRTYDSCACGRTLARIQGGILARVDDMISVRGVNVYPAAIESVVRRFPEIVEFRSTVGFAGAMRTLSLEIEPVPNLAGAHSLAAALSQQLNEFLGLKVPVHLVEPGGLPRFEMKSRRFVVER